MEGCTVVCNGLPEWVVKTVLGIVFSKVDDVGDKRDCCRTCRSEAIGGLLYGSSVSRFGNEEEVISANMNSWILQ